MISERIHTSATRSGKTENINYLQFSQVKRTAQDSINELIDVK